MFLEAFPLLPEQGGTSSLANAPNFRNGRNQQVM
jgi:hypothetical protein